MKLDDDYTSVDVCPKTGEQLTDNDVFYNDGICPHCGDARSGTITHHTKVPGRWNRASLFERLFQGKKTEFFTKEDEDKVWGTLKDE